MTIPTPDVDIRGYDVEPFDKPMSNNRRYTHRMAMIECPECGAEISDRATTCPQCGAPRFESKLIVSAPTQAMLVSPKVVVILGGLEVAQVRRGELVEIPVDVDSTVTFKSGIRQTQTHVSAGRVTRVQLAWDRVSGKLVAQHIEAITTGHSPL